MKKALVAICAVLFVSLFEVSAEANCPTFTTFSNGQTANADQVMGNFNYILQRPNFTGNVGIGISTPSTLLTLAKIGSASSAPMITVGDRGIV